MQRFFSFWPLGISDEVFIWEKKAIKNSPRNLLTTSSLLYSQSVLKQFKNVYLLPTENKREYENKSWNQQTASHLVLLFNWSGIMKLENILEIKFKC